MLFLTVLPRIPGAWIQDAPVGTHCNNMECLTPSVPRGEDEQGPQSGGGQWDDRAHCRPTSLLSIHLQLHSTPHQDHHHHQDMT